MRVALKSFAIASMAILLVASAFINSAEAQRRSGTASLGELGCKKFAGTRDIGHGFNDGGYKRANEDVVIGGELLRAIAFFGNNDTATLNQVGIYQETPEKVACRLAPVKGASEFKTLMLQFGFSDGSKLLDGSVSVRLRVLLDGNFYGEKLITRGDLIPWSIPVTGKRSITLETECVRAKQGERACPNIWFVEDRLTR